MTTPTVPAPPSWDEDRLRAALRSLKPFTPRVRSAFERFIQCARAYGQAHADYELEAALSGAPDLSRLRSAARRLGAARRKALIAMGQDPDTSDAFPPTPEIPHDA